MARIQMSERMRRRLEARQHRLDRENERLAAEQALSPYELDDDYTRRLLGYLLGREGRPSARRVIRDAQEK